MNTGLVWAAAAVSLATLFGHVFAGGPRVAKPLLASDELPEQAKWIGYFCWHVTSILVLAMSVGFALTALHPDLSILAVFLSALSALIWVLSVGITVVEGYGSGITPASGSSDSSPSWALHRSSCDPVCCPMSPLGGRSAGDR